jgi:3-hydroxyisobutyrate dehydrogenase-like beta-hydroxyacid dehydrogenase
MEIAFLGLGNMGSGMAHRLLLAGHSLRVWNRTAEKADALEAEGAVVCGTPAEAVAGAPVVISALMDDNSIRALMGGPQGLAKKMAANAIHLCTMTISPACGDWLAAEHAAQGGRYVSGPVVGRPDAAAAGTLMQFLAGDASAIEELLPVTKAFASTVVPLAGRASVANLQKLCTNLFIVGLVEVMGECYTLAEKGGASTELLEQFFLRSLAHPGMQGYARRMRAREIGGEGGFSVRGGLKDVSLMLDAGAGVGCPLELAAVVQGKLRDAVAGGLGDADWSAIQEVTRERAGLGMQGRP